MYALGPLVVYLGWARPYSQAKNLYVVVPLLRYTMQKEHCSFCNPLWDFKGLAIALVSPPTPCEIKTTFVVYLLSPHQLKLVALDFYQPH